MKPITTILFLALLVGLTACKKNSTVVIQAQNYENLSDGSAYAGMKYAISESWTPFYETKSKVVASGYLNQNGQAAFELKIKESRKYVLEVQQPDNICYGGVEQHYLDYENNNNVTFQYAQCSYSKLIINNVNCYDSNDKLILYRSDDFDIIDSSYGWEHDGCAYWETTGGTDDDPIGYSSIPCGNRYYKWIVTKNGITNTYYDTVFYNAGEYKTYEINY